jgi:uncharacterized protein
MNLDLPLSEDELDELDALLMSEAVPEEGMEISTLDGFLAAIVLNPQVILPSQWLPWVWDMENGEASPEFADAQQANRIIGLLMRHYNTVAWSIDGGWFDPLLVELEQPDGSEFFDAEGWCEGFMLGVSAVPDSWRAVLEVHTDLVAPMVLLGTDKGLKILEESGHEVELRRRRIQNAYEAIPAAVAALHEHFRPESKRSFDPDASPGHTRAAAGCAQGRSQRSLPPRLGQEVQEMLWRCGEDALRIGTENSDSLRAQARARTHCAGGPLSTPGQ